MLNQKLINRKYSKSEPNKSFIIKEVFDEEELIQYFRLRYNVYLNMGYIAPNKDEMDIDFWDLKSGFFGVFKKETNELIGALRYIINKGIQNKCYSIVKEITDKLTDPKFDTMFNYCDFPMMQAFNIEDFIEAISSKDRIVVEVGRFTILPQYCGNNFAILLIQYAMSKAKDYKIDDCIIAVHPNHSPVYERFGFKLITETTEVIYPGINNTAIAMHLDISKTYESHRSIALKMQQRVREKGYY